MYALWLTFDNEMPQSVGLLAAIHRMDGVDTLGQVVYVDDVCIIYPFHDIAGKALYHDEVGIQGGVAGGQV